MSKNMAIHLKSKTKEEETEFFIYTFTDGEFETKIFTPQDSENGDEFLSKADDNIKKIIARNSKI